MSSGQGFYWERQAAAEKLFLAHIDQFKRANSDIGKLEQKLLSQTSTRLLDWIDHLVLPPADDLLETLDSLGFEKLSAAGQEAYCHPGALLPGINIVSGGSQEFPGIALRVENIADFQQANNLHTPIEGKPFSKYRRALISSQNSISFHVVERMGYRGFELSLNGGVSPEAYWYAMERWKNIPRGIEDEELALNHILKTAEELADTLGKDLAAHVICKCERDYWMTRNYAGRIQRSRQEVLGLGWANHDHHTFRSSRRHFGKLINLFTLLGFAKRERFYAGDEAGWGAQVMENMPAGLTLFLDVDLNPHEIDLDFSSVILEEQEHFGTIGLWCSMHGDSILKAGMHHLAGRFEFNNLCFDIAEFGVEFMAPFSEFSYLKQSFSKPEIWQVGQNKIDVLRSAGKITAEQAGTFLNSGAVGSHLENIQRREGYKGFNKKNVSVIIKGTDPRL